MLRWRSAGMSRENVRAFSCLAPRDGMRLNGSMRYPRSMALIALASILLLSRVSLHAGGPAADMQVAASAFMATLSADQKTKVVHSLSEKERQNWNFVPMARAGLP